MKLKLIDDFCILRWQLSTDLFFYLIHESIQIFTKKYF
jgi:hypothetical protein